MSQEKKNPFQLIHEEVTELENLFNKLNSFDSPCDEATNAVYELFASLDDIGCECKDMQKEVLKKFKIKRADAVKWMEENNEDD